VSVSLPFGQSARSASIPAGRSSPALVAVLSDTNMPGMDGLQLLGEIKQRRPNLPVMMVTAYGDEERRRRALELGASAFIRKPVDFEKLKSLLRQLPAAANGGNPAQSLYDLSCVVEPPHMRITRSEKPVGHRDSATGAMPPQ